MKTFIVLAGYTFPIAAFIFAGSYFGIWKRIEQKLPTNETIILFFVIWVISATLIFVFKILLEGQVKLTQSSDVNLLWTIIIGIIIGRNIIGWRRNVNTKKRLKEKTENT